MATLNIKNIPDELYARLRARSAQQHRSISQEVVHILEKTLAETRELSILDLKGLGKEAWRETGAEQHVRSERDSWD
jgi:plasmid stability protein